ncbi:MAG TPA: hypothetical protein VNZ49_09395, partial [Bacteroidia bacterium]|nr:hypothetical protein [Bacteroidia bacterium]
MIKIVMRSFYCVCVCLVTLAGKAQTGITSIPVFNNDPQRSGTPEFKINSDGSMRMKGVIRHHSEMGEKAVMVADLPAGKVKQECWFFGGDSLNGFDFEAAGKQAALEGDKMYLEFKVFMFRTQAAFVKNKYKIEALPYEIAMQNKRNVPPGVLVSACNNMDFENGDFSNWVGASGDNQNSNAFLNALGGATFTTNQNIYSCADLQLISSAYGNDPVGAFPGLDPNGGNYSARLGGYYINEATGYDGGTCSGSHWSAIYSNGEYIRQTFTVSPSNALISFDYAVILNDGGHPNGQQPYFHVYVTNSSGTVLNSTCTEYYVQAPAGSPPPGFSNSGWVNGGDGSILYDQGWRSGSINLTPYLGQTVNLFFIAAGCTNGGHPGWAYVDATCGSAVITVANVNPCTGTTTTMSAPPVFGGSYSWSGPGIVGSTTVQTITVNASGTYTVVVTPPQGAACQYTLTKSVTFITTPTIAPSASPASICSGSSTTLNANATNATSYSWNPSGSTASSVVV